MRSRSPRLLHRAVVVAVLGALICASAVSGALPSGATSVREDRNAARLDRANLRLAAQAVEAQAISSGAMPRAVSMAKPAKVLWLSVEALITRIRSADPSRRPTSTRAVMGPIPYNLTHPVRRRPWHRDITTTHTLHRFTHSIPDSGSAGWGTHAFHGGGTPARFQKPDGVYVDPRLPKPKRPVIASVAIRAALQKLGQPYVYAAAGPTTFDCSGLAQWAYAHAGIRLQHFTGWQWNEGRLINPRDAAPGDLVLIGRTIHHVGIYLGAGWMVNAPITGHYVDVVPVPTEVDGLIRP